MERLRLHFLFGEDCWYDGPEEDIPRIEQQIKEHIGLIGEGRYTIRLLTDEKDPLLRHVYVEDLATIDGSIDITTIPCHVTQEIPRCTVWIDPPSKEGSLPFIQHYTEYFQFYLNNGMYYNVRYWKTFDQIELHRPTPLASHRYEYLSCLLKEQEQDQEQEQEQEREQEQDQEQDQ